MVEEIIKIIFYILGALGFFTSAIYFFVNYKKDMKILDKQIQQSEKELAEIKKVNQEQIEKWKWENIQAWSKINQNKEEIELKKQELIQEHNQFVSQFKAKYKEDPNISLPF